MGPVFDYLALATVGLGFATLAALLYTSLRRGDGEAERLRARIGELLAEKEALEKKLLAAEEELARARSQCEREKQELRRQMEERLEAMRREYEERLREAMDENKAALALYEAVKAGVVRVQADGCREVLVQLDGQVLCRVSETELRVLWPREPSGKTEAGEG